MSGFSDTGLLEQAHPFSQQAVNAESHGDSRRDAFIRLPYQLTPGPAVLVPARYNCTCKLTRSVVFSPKTEISKCLDDFGNN